MAGSEVLNAAEILGIEAHRESDVIDQIREGFPARTIEAVEDRLGLSQADFAVILGVPERTLSRRRSKPDESLPVDESDRLFRIALILNVAIEALGDEERAKNWLRVPNVALGGEAPLAMLDTEPGARAVEDALGRIAHGVFS
jgi:putative toxin-antitoxin system antitoxin component (TIGR02293 family)